MTERLHFHFSLSCIGQGNGNPLQCSCLENPRDRGAWWAAVSVVAQSQTRLKRLSSSSSSEPDPYSYGGFFFVVPTESLMYPLSLSTLDEIKVQYLPIIPSLWYHCTAFNHPA